METYCDSTLSVLTQSVREIPALTATASRLAWSIGCSGRSFQIVSSPIVLISFSSSVFHFCSTHLESQSCNIIQAERYFRRTLVQLFAQISESCKVKHVALNFICSGLETLRGYRLHSLSGQPLLLLD